MKWSILLFAVLVASSDAKVKVKEFDGVLSDAEHFGDEEGHEHNTQYDHEAFLGKDDAKTFDDLSPEDSKEKLGQIYHKVDTDNDGQVTHDELKKWMIKTQNRYAQMDADENMKNYDKNGDNSISFDEFKSGAYGFLNEKGEVKDAVDPEKYPKYHKDETNKEYYNKQIAKDERRYKYADKNGDGVLSLDELSGFLHPESQEHMRKITALETIEDMDKDNDNKISLDEFMADLSSEVHASKDAEEPDWMKEERKNFTEIHDTNKDGKLDVDEVKQWIFPPEEDYLADEADHLVQQADADADGKLTKDEMLDKYDIFIGSQATDYGEMLKDEL